MSVLAERKLYEWGLWYEKNKDRIPPENLKKKCEFYEKAITGLFECLALQAKDIQELEGGQQSGLILPTSVQVNGFDPVRVR